jgi:hypothetical protein
VADLKRSAKKNMNYEILWKDGDKERFERFADVAFPKFEHIGAALVKKFCSDMQLHPVEWPTSERLPFDDVFKAGPVRLRYCVVPAKQEVEVLSVEHDTSSVVHR